jgi:hypothetical protein
MFIVYKCISSQDCTNTLRWNLEYTLYTHISVFFMFTIFQLLIHHFSTVESTVEKCWINSWINIFQLLIQVYFCSLCNSAVSNQNYVPLNGLVEVSNEWGKVWKEAAMVYIQALVRDFWGGPNENRENSQSRISGLLADAGEPQFTNVISPLKCIFKLNFSKLNVRVFL